MKATGRGNCREKVWDYTVDSEMHLSSRARVEVPGQSKCGCRDRTMTGWWLV